jgi:HD superfamily phosphohydrolase
MTRQLKISENVHTMLSLLKPFPSSSYDEVIRGLIEDAAPYLPYELERIRRLEENDIEEAASEYGDLQQRLLEDYTIERLIRKKEYEQERAEQEAFDEAERETEEAIDRAIEEKEREEEAEIDRSVEGYAKTHGESRTTTPKKTGRSPKKRGLKK